MKSNTEMIYNVSLAREVFYEFIDTCNFPMKTIYKNIKKKKK